MSEKTLRELAEAVRDAGSLREVAAATDRLNAAMAWNASKTILAALDAEREAGRREALEEVRAWLKLCWQNAGEEDDRTAAEYRMSFDRHFPEDPVHD